MKNRSVKRSLVREYGKHCWLKGMIIPGNPLTFHHIKPLREGGETTIENGALLTAERHAMFNVTEINFPEYAEEINYYFKKYRGKYPELVDKRIDEYIEMMYEFQSEYLPKCKKLYKRK